MNHMFDKKYTSIFLRFNTVLNKKMNTVSRLKFQ